ncbi:MAG: EAL domain-containing protein [Lamprobacter sp.]|uniref:putative bifunctional diguanylate cyclase/phosphodiesterase n=1 Tax=Lamprobacter sp. TaxID=3100796 RepID=UPI002B25D5D0|nr:EAL domain-containing protein [Lamprobacter sp.]MEA3641524.1 EAL domain-containing protein [Lamprobacter sp.]
MDDVQTAKEVIDFYRQQSDEIGSRLLRAQAELRSARRDAQRQRIIAAIIQRLYRLEGQEPSDQAPDHWLGEKLVALLVEVLQVDCAALLSGMRHNRLLVEHALGLDAAFQLPLSAPLPEQAISSAPEQIPTKVDEALAAHGLQRWLWASSTKSDRMLLLGHRRQLLGGVELAFETGDQAIAEAVLAVYLALTEQRSATRALHSAEIDYRTLFESAQDAFVIIDAQNNQLLEANQQALRLLGADFEQMQQRPIISWLADPDPRAWRRRWHRALCGRTQQLECRLRTLAGQPFWVELRLTRIGAIQRGRLLLIGRDISKRKKVELQLRQYAFRDELTQLPNRALMYRRLGEALERQRQEPGYQFALLFLDIDRFKTINDSLGHSLGDRLLVAIGQRLTSQLHKDDSIARLGGDEFLILANKISDAHNAQAMAARIEQALLIPFTVSGQEIFTSASIGIVLADASYSQPEALLRDADIAMYQAKRHDGRERRYALFNPAMHARAIADMELERDLRRALESTQELTLFYQPILRLKDGRITGFEALVRWRHPQHGLVRPDRFIPLAEDTLLILDISRFVLREASRQAAAWATEFTRPPIVNVNLSGRQFISSEVAEETSQLVAEAGCPPALINIEITESAILTDKALALAGMEGLHAQGFKLSMDDFGTGYSSLSYLHEFPFDSIKIDGSFVNTLTSEPRTAAIVTAILRLAETLEKQVIAEGIETPEQLATLQQLGCNAGQGYLFSPPVEASAAEAMFRQRPWESAAE